MSVVTLTSNTAASPLAGDSSPHAPVDVSRGKDVYAAWKAVFEHSRAVEPTRDGAGQSDAGADGAGSEQSSRAAAADVQSETSARHDFRPNYERSGEASRMPRVAAFAKAIAGNAARTSAAPVANPGQMPQLMRSTAIESATARAVATPKAEAPAARTLATESVQVFVQGAAVAIVVRDTSLSADEAMHCAFQTARELTGRSDTLQQLTLNGRTIYQQQRSGATQEPAPEAGQGTCVLEFAC